MIFIVELYLVSKSYAELYEKHWTNCHHLSKQIRQFLIFLSDKLHKNSSSEGAGNNALKIMEEIYGEVMPKFYEWYSFKRGGTPGGDFTGKHSSLI